MTTWRHAVRNYAGGLALSLLSLSIASAQSKVGTTAAQFLGIPVGMRSVAMGGTGVAQSEDVSAVYWNPGAMAQVPQSAFAFVNTDWLAGTKFQWFGFMLKLDPNNAVGLSFTQLDYGEDEVTTVDQPDGTGQRWSARDLAIGVSYARRLTDRFSIGGSGKYVSQSIWNESASTITFDVGLLFVTGLNDMRLGMSMSNFGGDMQLDGRDLLNKIDIDPNYPGGNKTLVGKLKTDSWPTPLFFRVGAAMDLVKSDAVTATVAVDALRPSDNQMTVNAGAEVTWMNLLSLRGGYKAIPFSGIDKAYGQNTQQDGLTLGAGLRYEFTGVGTIEVSYTYISFGDFGNLNAIGLGFAF